MERGTIRTSRGLSAEAITITLEHARMSPATREAGIALAHGAHREIRAAFKKSTPPAVAVPHEEKSEQPADRAINTTDDGTTDEAWALAVQDIRRGQVWISKQYVTSHEVSGITDGRVEMTGPVGNHYEISPWDLRNRFTLDTSKTHGTTTNNSTVKVSETIWRNADSSDEDGEYYVRIRVTCGPRPVAYQAVEDFYTEDGGEAQFFDPESMTKVEQIDGMDAREWIHAMYIMD